MSEHTYQIKVGDFTCTIVDDGETTMSAHDIKRFYSNAKPQDAAALAREQGYDPDAIPRSRNCMVIDTGQQQVLVDTGMGYVGEGRLVERLSSIGIQPESIDLVILTHGHGDHFNGLIDQTGHRVFSNAVYVMWATEWMFWTSDARLTQIEADSPERAAGIRQRLLPIKDHVRLIDESTVEILPGITAVPAPGHTPGHIAIKVESGNHMLVHIADAILNPLHMQRPDWIASFDTDSQLSHTTRVQLVEWAVENNVLMIAYHFGFPGAGHWAKDGEVWRWKPIGT